MVKSVERCIDSVQRWMRENFLKLNEEKTEILIITSRHFKTYIPDVEFAFGNTKVIPSEKAKNIGVIFDNQMTLSNQISNVCRSSHFQLRSIGAIRKHLTSDACKTLIHSFITSKIDYCNALYFGLPQCQLQHN